MSDLQDKIYDIVCDKLGVQKENITPESRIVDDLGADSLDQVELIMALEEAFEINISDEEAGTIKTIQDIVKYISEQKG